MKTFMRNQSVKVVGGYRGQVTGNSGHVVAETIRVFRDRNAAVIEAWKVLLLAR
jgi:hypothetical protein